MGSFTKLLVFLSVLTCILAFEEESHKSLSANNTRLGRTGRKNYGVYRPPPSKEYGDDGDDKDESGDDNPSSPNSGNPPQGSDYPNFGNYKGYDQYFNYPPPPRYPSFASNYKGSPFYSPYWKGGKPGDSAMPPASPDQMMEMMMALSNMEDTTKPEDTGILSKLISDPKSAAAAAIIPLSIVAAAVVPVLMNYMMTGGSNQPQVISTTANNKEGRSIGASNNFEVIMEHISRFTRAMDNDECVQKTICRIARGDADIPVSDHMKRAVLSLARMVKDDWVNNYGVKNLFDGIKQGNCNNVCNIVKSQSRQ